MTALTFRKELLLLNTKVKSRHSTLGLCVALPQVSGRNPLTNRKNENRSSKRRLPQWPERGLRERKFLR